LTETIRAIALTRARKPVVPPAFAYGSYTTVSARGLGRCMPSGSSDNDEPPAGAGGSGPSFPSLREEERRNDPKYWSNR